MLLIARPLSQSINHINSIRALLSLTASHFSNRDPIPVPTPNLSFPCNSWMKLFPVKMFCRKHFDFHYRGDTRQWADEVILFGKLVYANELQRHDTDNALTVCIIPFCLRPTPGPMPPLITRGLALYFPRGPSVDRALYTAVQTGYLKL